MNDLKALCFDVLGEFVDPKEIRIDHHSRTVRIPDLPLYLHGLVRGDWEAAIAGTEHSRYRLIIGSSKGGDSNA